MSWILHDPDEWEAKSESTIYGRDPFGNVLGSCSMSLVRRSPEAVAAIKVKKRKEHEDAVLAEAAQIVAQRKGFFAQLTPEQQEQALAYRGEDC